MKKYPNFHFIYIWIIISCGSVVSFNYITNYGNNYTSSGAKVTDLQVELHKSVIGHSAPSPYNYRILVPYLVEMLVNSLQAISHLPYRKSFQIAYALYYYIIINLFLISLFYFLKLWHDSLYSMLGVLTCAALLPISLRDHYFQPWSLLEINLYLWAAIYSFRSEFKKVLPLAILGSLNRETGVFIPILYFLTNYKQCNGFWKMIKQNQNLIISVALTLLLSITILLSIRIYQGAQSDILTVTTIFHANLSNLFYSVVHLLLFAGIFWYYSVNGIKVADLFTRRLLLFFAVYIIPILIFGIWQEVRMIMPMYPVLISLSLFYVKTKVVNNT